MKVRELIKDLLDYNPDAEVSVVVSSRPYWFDIAFGCVEGCTKRTATSVSLEVATTKEQALDRESIITSPPAEVVEKIPISWAYELTNRFYGSDANLAYSTFEKALEELRQKVKEGAARQQALKTDGGARQDE